ncbi:hypothetical protein ACIGCZ_15400 [Streptomyces nigra]|uniref:hypothetical protein n=1 Tax=Streptomyces nigra TaxID=1827580 RepID=UPI0037D06941
MNSIAQASTATPEPRAQHSSTDEQGVAVTYQAAGVYVAREIYAEALKQTNPAKTLDDICDALPEVMPQVVKAMGTAPSVAAALLPGVTDRLEAFTAVERARVDAGDGYGYLFDYLADGLSKGADPKAVRAQALAAPGRIRELAAQAEGAA